MRYPLIYLILALTIYLMPPLTAQAQERALPRPNAGKVQEPAVPAPGEMARQKEIVQFTGLVVSGEQAFGVQNVTVAIPRTRRGTTTNQLGYFSIPVLAGDSAVISALGYKRRSYIVPASREASHSVIIYLEADTLMLPSVEVFAYPTETLFKQAFLALNVDNRDVINARKNLDPYTIEEMAAEQPLDGKMNYTVAMSQQIRRIETNKQVPQLQLLNPFAWAQFINQVKRGDFKKKDRKDKEE